MKTKSRHPTHKLDIGISDFKSYLDKVQDSEQYLYSFTPELRSKTHELYNVLDELFSECHEFVHQIEKKEDKE